MAKETKIGFLKKLYEEDPVISNSRALKFLLARFPESSAGIKDLLNWKNILRKRGVRIPRQRA